MPPLYWRAAKPAIADSLVTSQSRKWLLERPRLVPRWVVASLPFVVTLNASLQTFDLVIISRAYTRLMKTCLSCSFIMGSERPLRQRCTAHRFA